jgi:hypothetical protein
MGPTCHSLLLSSSSPSGRRKSLAGAAFEACQAPVLACLAEASADVVEFTLRRGPLKPEFISEPRSTLQ